MADLPAPAGRRGGRRTGKPDTRDEILVAARCLIAKDGCAATSLRATARYAGVDAALITHYFGSRDGLLRAALSPDDRIVFDFHALLDAGPREEFGERLARRFLTEMEARHDQPHPVLSALGLGMDSAVAGEVLEEVLARTWAEPLAAVLAEAQLSDQPELAAELAGALILTLSMVGRVPGTSALSGLCHDALATYYGRLLQAVLTGSFAAELPSSE